MVLTVYLKFSVWFMVLISCYMQRGLLWPWWTIFCLHTLGLYHWSPSSILMWYNGHRDDVGGSSRVRFLHCTSVWLTIFNIIHCCLGLTCSTEHPFWVFSLSSHLFSNHTHITILMRFSWPSLAYMCTKVTHLFYLSMSHLRIVFIYLSWSDKCSHIHVDLLWSDKCSHIHVNLLFVYFSFNPVTYSHITPWPSFSIFVL